MKSVLCLLAVCVLVAPSIVSAQTPAPAGQGPAAAAAPKFSVSSTSWPDGGEIPMRYASRGENKSPAFEFHWVGGAAGVTPATPPSTLQSYAVIFHDVENSTMRTTVDTLHWSAFNIPAAATALAEGLGSGDLPDGTINGPGLARRNNMPGAYFGPGAGPGPFHHYVFEFYALDTKLTLPGTTTRDELLKAMDGHVIGKAAYTGRFHAPAP
jgi:Raf kinase inhibitor-like YbhB/YbcL family protein